MSNGQLLNHCSVKCLDVQTVEADLGAIIAKLSTAFYGYCEPAHHGRICQTDFRHTRLAIVDSNYGSKMERCVEYWKL
jgi:hypothetical protein